MSVQRMICCSVIFLSYFIIRASSKRSFQSQFTVQPSMMMKGKLPKLATGSDLIAIKPIIDYPNPEFLDEKVLQKRLPWQLGLFLKVVPPQPDPPFTESADGKFLTILQHPVLDTMSSFLRKRFSFVFAFVSRYKHRLLVIGRGIAMIWIGYVMIKRLIHWYTGVTEYELLLDSKDYEYQRYGGGRVDEVGTAYLAQLNTTFTENFQFQPLVEKISMSLNRPCFPHTMKSYAIQIGKDIAEVLMMLDPKIRSYRKALSSRTNHGSSSNYMGRYHQNYHLKSNPLSLSSADQLLTEEAVTIFTLQRLITLLQVRQADAYLRLSRMSVLSAINLCEDLLEHWKEKVIKKSQTLRIPIFQTLISNLLGFSVGIRSKTSSQMRKAMNIMNFYDKKREVVPSSTDNSSNVERVDGDERELVDKQEDFKKSIEAEYIDDMLRDLNAREKIIVLENLLSNLYTVTGEIQHHLETADGVLSAVSSKTDLKGLDDSEEEEELLEESSPLERKLGIDCMSTTIMSWKEVEEWIEKSSSLSRKAMSIVSIRTKFTSSESSGSLLSGNTRRYSRVSSPSLLNTNLESSLTLTTTSLSDPNITSPSSEIKIDPSLARSNSTLDNLNNTAQQKLNVRPYYSEELINYLTSLSFEQSTDTTTFTNLVEFILPGTVSQLLELSVVNSTMFDTILEEHSGGRIIRTIPWKKLDEKNNIAIAFNHSLPYLFNHKDLAFREIIYQNDSTKGGTSSLLSRWSPYQSLTKVANIHSLYYSEEEDRESGFATLTLFQDFSQSSTNSFMGNITTVWKFENILSVATPTPSTKLTKSISNPPARSSYGYYRSALLGASKSASVSRSIYQTKVTVQIECKMEPSLYYYFILNLMRQESKRFIAKWRSETINSLNQYHTGATFSSTVFEKSEATSDQNQLLNRIRSTRYPREEDVEGSKRPLYTHEFIARGSPEKAEEGNASFLYDQTSNDVSAQNLKREASLTVDTILPHINQNMQLHRSYWRSSAIVLRDINKAPSAFNKHLESIGLKKSSKQMLLVQLFRPRFLFRFSIWLSILLAGFELNKRSNNILWTKEFFMNNMKDFIDRRIATPTLSIVNDVLLNKRTSITDRQALLDAKRSLSSMLYDFLLQEYPKLSEAERRKAAIMMDMRPISEEYERELKRPIQNIVSGKILRLVLIQLQFVKKELLVAMEAIDQLFNANQVNLQLLAITPAIVAIFSLQVIARGVIAAVKSISRGKALQSTSVIHQDLKNSLRELERLLAVSSSFEKEATVTLNVTSVNSLSPAETGQLLSHLYRIQLLLVLHSSNFEYGSLKQLQEDLRDLSTAHITVKQRLLILERIHRRYSFLQPNRGLFGMI